MSDFETITRFIVPLPIVHETDDQLRAAGREGVERFVLWSGMQAHDIFYVRSSHVPRQTAYRLLDGLCVRVDGDELHRLNLWLFEHHEQLGVQVHTHPAEAYHSETDDTYPIVTVRGGLSLVVPNFGRDGVQGPDVAWYRLGRTDWNELSLAETKQLIQFVE